MRQDLNLKFLFKLFSQQPFWPSWPAGPIGLLAQLAHPALFSQPAWVWVEPPTQPSPLTRAPPPLLTTSGDWIAAAVAWPFRPIPATIADATLGEILAQCPLPPPPNRSIRCLCRRGETTYAIGWLKWGPN
jgi:hypothetical protein